MTPDWIELLGQGFDLLAPRLGRAHMAASLHIYEAEGGWDRCWRYDLAVLVSARVEMPDGRTRAGEVPLPVVLGAVAGGGQLKALAPVAGDHLVWLAIACAPVRVTSGRLWLPRGAGAGVLAIVAWDTRGTASAVYSKMPIKTRRGTEPLGDLLLEAQLRTKIEGERQRRRAARQRLAPADVLALAASTAWETLAGDPAGQGFVAARRWAAGELEVLAASPGAAEGPAAGLRARLGDALARAMSQDAYGAGLASQRGARQVESLEGRQGARPAAPEATGLGVEALAMERESERELRRLISDEGLKAAGLSPRQVDIITLKREGKTEQEITRKLGLSQQAVSKSFRAAIAKLQKRARDF